ncbi:TPA: amidohydrolase [Clostridioides difficile]|nr:amidohydrolase [Clostridioides difficile]
MKEKIYYNGNIITMEDSICGDAILIKDKIIKKIGTKEEVFALKNKDTEIIDLQGKTLMPSFIDSHSHLIAFATTLKLVPLEDATSFKDIVKKIQDFKESNNIKKGDWIIGFSYDNNFLEENKHPDKNVLDSASSENPILISHASGHMGVANTLGLKQLGVTNETYDPEGGHIGRVEGSEEPNGYLEENAFFNVSSKIKPPSSNEIFNSIEKAQDIYLSYGITIAQEGLMEENQFNLLKAMANQNKLKIDVVGYVNLKKSKPVADNNREFIKKYINRFKIGGYKIFLDGSPQGKTAWLSKPYENSDDGYCGYPIYKDEEVEKFIDISLKEKMQLLTHCNGDAAAEQLIDVFEKVLTLKEQSSNNMRPVMIHAQTVREDQIDDMKRINMIPSYFVAHTYYWGDIHIKNLGEDRAFKISPLKTTIEKGLIYTLHQDTPVIAPNMLETVWCAVNRITKKGVQIGENEKISPLDALKGVTINAAYQYFEEDKKGSIKEGKLANLIILDENPLTIDPMKIKDIKVLQTIREGEVLYSLK